MYKQYRAQNANGTNTSKTQAQDSTLKRWRTLPRWKTVGM